MTPLESDARSLTHSKLLWDSFFKWTGKHLIEEEIHLDPVSLSTALYHAPFVLISHGNETDPVFNYANLKAQQLWKMPWEAFTSLPSRYSAEPVNREERQQLLEQAERYGHITGYQGVRITAEGLRFRIKDTVLWNVVDDKGLFLGQAAVFKEWDWL